MVQAGPEDEARTWQAGPRQREAGLGSFRPQRHGLPVLSGVPKSPGCVVALGGRGACPPPASSSCTSRGLPSRKRGGRARCGCRADTTEGWLSPACAQLCPQGDGATCPQLWVQVSVPLPGIPWMGQWGRGVSRASAPAPFAGPRAARLCGQRGGTKRYLW